MRRVYAGDLDRYAGGSPHELFDIESIVGKFGDAVASVVGEVSKAKAKTIDDYAKQGFDYGALLRVAALEFYPVYLLAATAAGASLGYLQDRYGDPSYELGR